MSVEFSLEKAHLPRLSALIAQSREDAVGGAAPELSADVALGFAFRQQPRFIEISGNIKARFGLMCQRCLELAPLEVDVAVSLAVVAADKPGDYLESVKETHERWDHDGDELLLAEVVDELILLELPLVIMHEERTDCGRLAGEARFAAQSERTQRPFADLSALLGDKSS